MIVSDEHIIEEREISEEEVATEAPGVHIQYNQTDPHIIRDGVDFIAVSEYADDAYRIDYWGYMFGRLIVEPAGVEELGQELLDPNEAIPNWIIDAETVDVKDPPWWVPEDIEFNPTFQCTECGEDKPVQEAVAPSAEGSEDPPCFCQDCWEIVR